MVEATTTTDTESTGTKKSSTAEEALTRKMHHKAATGFLKDWNAALDTSGTEKEDGKHFADRGDRAQLRRCRSIDEVLLTPVYFKVRHQLRNRGVETGRDRALASLVGLLARVKTNDESASFGRQLATKRKDSQDVKLSGLRFRRLLQINNRDALYEKMIGVIRLLDGKVNIPSFSTDIYYWRPGTSSAVRKRWAEQYYSSAPDEI